MSKPTFADLKFIRNIFRQYLCLNELCKTKFMKKVFSVSVAMFFILVLLVTQASAQFQGGGQGGPGGNPAGNTGMGNAGNAANKGSYQGMGMGSTTGTRPSIGHVLGKVVDSKTKKGVEFASVALFKAKNDSLITGQLTESNGDFSLDNLPFGKFKLKVSFLGYTPLDMDITIMPTSLEQDLGNVALTQDEKTLKTVTVTGEKSTIELKADRKVFNVEKDLSARGGTGIDVMKNIPGVSTDADGNVTLRNSTPIIYVDGKPTTLTMDQIPADQIEKVEVITNPSAKYEASAAGGIINVVLKKNRVPGYNGMINASIGTNEQYNAMALFNVREKKFGFSLNYNINGSTNRTNNYTDRRSLDSIAGNAENTRGYFHQNDQITNKRLFQTARVGFDGYINNHNTLSITQSGTFGSFNTVDNQQYYNSDSTATQLVNGLRVSNQDVSFRNFTTDLSLVHTYTKPDKQWTLDFNFNHAHGNTTNLYSFNTYLPDGTPVPFNAVTNPQSETQNGGSHSNMITAQWDFEDPINSNMKLEFGARSNFQRQFSNLTVTDFDSSTSVTNAYLSNNYRTDNLVNAAYVNFSHTVKGFSYQLGLRFEETYFSGTLLSSHDSTFSYAFPSSHASLNNILDCFFPSIMLSQKIGDKHEFQFNLTRKIQRPNFRQISPFVFASDKYNFQIGNPALQPELQNKAEFNYDLMIPKLTWLSSLYGSYNQMDITQYTYADPTDPTGQTLISSFINAKSNFRGGWENTFKISPVKGLDITADGNVFYNLIQTNVNGTEIDNHGVSYVIKGIISYKFPLAITAQVNGAYESPRIIAQGNTLPVYYFDCSLSKDFGMVALNLSVSDVLNSRTYGTYNNTPTYIQTSTRRRDQRYARLGVSFKFGKMDGSIFKKKKKSGGDQNGGDDMGY